MKEIKPILIKSEEDEIKQLKEQNNELEKELMKYDKKRRKEKEK